MSSCILYGLEEKMGASKLMIGIFINWYQLLSWIIQTTIRFVLNFLILFMEDHYFTTFGKWLNYFVPWMQKNFIILKTFFYLDQYFWLGSLKVISFSCYREQKFLGLRKQWRWRNLWGRWSIRDGRRHHQWQQYKHRSWQ